MTPLSRLADWITVVTAPVTLGTTAAAWAGILGSSSASRPATLTRTAVTMAFVTAAWAFFLLTHIRLSRRFHESQGSTSAFFSTGLSALLCLAAFVVAELLLLDTFLGGGAGLLSLTLWIGVFAVAWVIAVFAALLAQSATD